MTRPIVISDHAQNQLEAACRWWTEHRSENQAERWYEGFAEAILSLQDDPERFSRAPEDHLFPFDLLQLNYGLGARATHRALYVVRPDMVYVFSIRHLAQEAVSPDDF